MTERLREVLANWRERANHAHILRHEHDEQLINDIVDEVEKAARPFLEWLGESDAALYSGHSVSWLRSRFPGWERDGLTRWSVRGKKERQYLQVILPKRVDLDAIRGDALREASNG